MGKKKNYFTKINSALNNVQTQKITNVVKSTPAKYVCCECFNVLKNMWAEPEYTELIITSRAWYKLVAFIHLIGDYEISGFGRIQEGTYNGKKAALVTDFDIIKQEVKAAYVESDDDAVLDFIMKLPADQRSEWTLDWHSHVDMGTTPSGTDWNNYSDMLKARMGKQFPAMIVNKSGSITAHQIMSEAKHPAIDVKVEKTILSDTELLAIYNECKEKVENLCTKAVVATTYSYGSANKNRTGTWTGYNYKDCYDSSDYYSRHYSKDFDTYDDDDDWKECYYQGNKKDVEKAELEDEETDCETCQYCGAPASPWHTQQIGIGICKECFNEYVTP